MRRLALEILVATTLTIGAILALTPGVLANDVMVMGAFARASAVPTAKAGTVYMSLTNHGVAADRLMSVTTAAAESAWAMFRSRPAWLIAAGLSTPT